MKIRLALLFVLLAFASAASAVEPQQPRIPSFEISINDCGARGDGNTDNTKAVQKAIADAAKNGGGRVTFSEGVYLCGPIQLADRVELHLPKDVTLRMIPFSAAFPSEGGRYSNFISAKNCADIKITGEGVIDGQGAPWWKAFRAKELSMRRPQLIAFEGCERVLIEGFTTLNPPNTHFALRLCKDVTMRGLTLTAPDESPNTDGINISGKNYLITACKISTGDDNIVILTHAAKGWSAPVCENFEIRDCAFGFGHGVSIGSYTGGGVRGVLVENCTFDGTTAAIRMKAARDRGGLVENLAYRNITIKGARYPVYISSYYPKEPKTPSLDQAPATRSRTTPRWENILIENLTVTDSQNAPIIWGLPEQPIANVTIRNATFATQSGATVYHAQKIILENVVINCAKTPKLKQHKSGITGMTGGIEIQ